MGAQAGSFYRELGARLRQARERAGLSQEVLAERAALSRTSISNIESGRQRILAHTVYVLAGAVGVAPRELLPDSKDASRTSEVQQALLPNPGDQEERWVRKVIDAVTEGELG